MTGTIVVLVTAGSNKEARKIATCLVESHLAACVNISPPVRSLYWWKGQIADDREILLLIKTKRRLFAALKSAVLKTHSYRTPEIICLPVADGSADYLRWIEDSVMRPRQKKRRPRR